jgi:hypothetical protein
MVRWSEAPDECARLIKQESTQTKQARAHGHTRFGESECDMSIQIPDPAPPAGRHATTPPTPARRPGTRTRRPCPSAGGRRTRTSRACTRATSRPSRPRTCARAAISSAPRIAATASRGMHRRTYTFSSLPPSTAIRVRLPTISVGKTRSSSSLACTSASVRERGRFCLMRELRVGLGSIRRWPTNTTCRSGNFFSSSRVRLGEGVSVCFGFQEQS